MKKNKPTKSSIDSLTGSFLTGSLMKVSKAILFIAVIFASVSAARATVFDVTAYGAVGNNSTDNVTFIQNAVNAAALGGGTVYFPPGLYNVSGTVYVPSNVRLHGTGSTVYNTQIRLTTTHTALFEVQNGASGVVFKDLTLVSIVSPVWPRNTATETALIRTEGTTGISLKAGNRGISDVVIENVRATQFTRGISATPANLSINYSITNVKIRNYASDGNEYSLYTNTTGASNWDVQNMNVYPMYAGQNGIFLERSGAMRFLQLSCAGAGAGVCARLLGNGDTYFRQMHVEGPRLGICAGSDCDPATSDPVVASSSRITIENSATDGEFHRATDIASFNNRFWLDFPQPPAPPPPAYKFIGAGANSTLTSCANVWVSWNPSTHMSNTTVNIPSHAFPGLATTIQGCLDSYLTSVPVFNTGYEPDIQLSGDIDVTSPLYGATTAPGDDDTAAFVAAIAAARSGRKTRVFVPAGSYDIYSTLSLQDGETVLGAGSGSIINLKTSNTSLFKVVNGAGYPVSGITFRNLSLTADSTTGTKAIEFANYSTTAAGAASDYQIQNVDFKGFGTGVWVGMINGSWSNAQPMFDSVSIKDGDFTDNKTAVLVQGGNASHWNLENLRVDVPLGEDGVRVDGGGHVSTRNLSCTGGGTACQTIQRQGGTSIEALSATGVANALVVRWENGWTQFPVTVRNSDLIEGVYFQGRIYLNSVNNTYPASLIVDIPKEVRFGALKEGDDNNVAYGELSDVFSCDDTFTDLIATQNTWAYSGNLLKPVTYCY